MNDHMASRDSVTVQPEASPAGAPDPVAFKAWLERLAVLAGYESGGALAAETGEECWRDYFEDGYSPGQAWGEECSE